MREKEYRKETDIGKADKQMCLMTRTVDKGRSGRYTPFKYGNQAYLHFKMEIISVICLGART